MVRVKSYKAVLYGSEALKQEKKMENTKYEFLSTMRRLMNPAIMYIAFGFGNVKKLVLYDKSIYLWLNAKGDVHYCFSLYDKEYYTTSAIKLGSVLTSHFECYNNPIEVINNEKEQLKKVINATSNLNKALSDSERQSYFAGMNQTDPLELELKSSNDLDILMNNEVSKAQLYSTPPQQSKQNPLHDQDKLHKNAIQLSTYYLESHLNTTYIKISDLPIVHKEVYAPYVKLAFYIDKNGMNCRNSFIATEPMVKPLYYCDPEQSLIMKFILAMANNNINQALKIIAWIADSFTSFNKLPFALVLYSKGDTFMQLFYDEIIAQYLYVDEYEKIENDSLDKKSLSNKLDKKFIYNLHNITTPTILGEPAYELTNSLIYKDKQKLNNKTVITVGNILITSTTNYIPLISEDVPTVTVNVSSNIEELCKEYNIRPNKRLLANHIKNDFDNFVSVIRSIDLDQLCTKYQIIDYNLNDIHPDILDGNTDPVEVFDKLIRDKDITPFKSAATIKKHEKLVDDMESDFQLDRVDKAHLLDYFEMLFGKGIYQSNTVFIKVLRDDYSKTGEPFGDCQTHVRKGRGYYFL